MKEIITLRLFRGAMRALTLGTMLSLIASCVNENGKNDKPQLNWWHFDYSNDSIYTEKTTEHPTISPEVAVKMVNANYEGKIKLIFVKQSNDTLVVKIPDAQILTEEMGSAGARAFMATATYMLTEPAHVTHVTFDFTEGNHAVPGTYSRSSFNH